MSMFFGLNRTYTTEAIADVFTTGSTLNEGLVAAYKLNEESGTTVIDHGVNGLHGIINSAVELKQTGVFNTSMYFPSGSGSDINVPDSDLLSFVDNSFSISFLIKTDLSQTNYILTKGDSVNLEFSVHSLSTGNIFVRVYHDGGTTYNGVFTTDAPLSANNWHLVTIVVKAVNYYGGMNIYVDGIESSTDNQGALGNGISNTNTSLVIGLKDGAGWADCYLSDIFFWSKELSLDEINELIHPYLPENVFAEESTLNAGLVAAYKLNEKLDLPVVDYSGNHLHGSNNGATINQAGVFDTCYGFDGNDDKLSLPSSMITQVGGNMTLSFWINAVSSDLESWESFILHGSSIGFRLQRWSTENELTIRFDTSAGSNQAKTGNLTNVYIGSWVHVAFVIEGGNISFYRNGELTGTNTFIPGNGFVDNAEVLVAHDSGSRYAKGFFSDICFWNRALSASEVNELIHPYLPENSFPEQSTLNTGVVAHYKNSNRNVGKLVDYSGNNFHGYFTGSPEYVAGVFEYGLSFNGFDENAVAPKLSEMSLQNSSFSVFARFKANVVTSQSFLVGSRDAESDGSTNFYIRLENSAITSRVETLAGTTYISITSGAVINVGEWNTVLFNYNRINKSGELFINGISIGTDTHTSEAPPLDDHNIYIGDRNNARRFNGVIDEIIIFDEILNQYEVSELIHPYLPQNSFPEGSTLNNGVIAHYKNWNNNINSLIDYSGHGHHGEISGASYVAGVNKYGLDFESANSEYATLPNNSELNWGDQLTISARFKINSWKWQMLLVKEATQGLDFNFFGIDNVGRLRFSESVAGTWMTGGKTIYTDTWYHAVIVKDGTSRKVYIDGVLTKSDSLGTTPDNVDDIFHIGATISNNSRDYFDGVIDEIAIWNRALTQAEITKLQKPYKVFDYDSTLNDGIVASYDFNEMEGTTLFDYSGNGNHGTNIGAAILQNGAYGDERAYDFDGNNDKVTMDSPLLQEGDISICFVVKPSTLSNWKFIFSDYTYSNYGWDIGLMADGSLVCAFRNGSHVDGFVGSVFAIDTWVRVVVIQDSSNGHVYVYKNGSLAGTLTNQPIFGLNGNESAMIGSRVSDNYSDIVVDKVYAWNKILAEAEIAELNNFLQGNI